jgi:hypothetical protein
MTRIYFTKSCVHNRHKMVVGNILVVNDKVANDLKARGLADEYKGQYPPKKKIKFNLKDLK